MSSMRSRNSKSFFLRSSLFVQSDIPKSIKESFTDTEAWMLASLTSLYEIRNRWSS
ncbi:DEHA2B16544p [Debaryomyces hansenii CBS767]|uniref:DEHA2B16544p n=1 Tax=Debaryomyces hansenii (strain ATCC 36239 / CBS 767 / BCRC 21394 / JCM 1990 / NBRC 0083 / IGC 2968) TaxID=284592 RepID=Q6BVU8_DEBHA|nr:DEHA2B16544p [Debaryomyces hansenii CBS767]CAG85685.1 DEHA2B16544p [Debaryomyces hansenii CBS767]|eukprot:XP_457671.1 DEHA2B16544p [Debaryomyces hansenii CBS767]